MTHDWPASFVAFTTVVEKLTDRFHLVLTNLPGVGFGGPLVGPGWNTGRIAGAFNEVMTRLGYERYGVQGSGGGGWIAVEMGRQAPDRVLGVHVNGHVTFPSGDPADFDGLTEAEQIRLQRLQNFRDDMMGFNAIQSTRPHTLAHALHDSPAGQLAWIVEKFKEWTDPAAELPEDAVGRDTLLTNVSVYWFAGTAGSSANLYYEMAHDPAGWAPKDRSPVPHGGAAGREHRHHHPTLRRAGQRRRALDGDAERGGNFLSLEQPDAYAADVRAFFDGLSG